VNWARKCERLRCQNEPVATLTFVYQDSTAVLGPLAVKDEPFAYDLCAAHAERLKAPRGWEVIRLSPDRQAAPPSQEQIDALASQVRERGRLVANQSASPQVANLGARYGHLRSVPTMPPGPATN